MSRETDPAPPPARPGARLLLVAVAIAVVLGLAGAALAIQQYRDAADEARDDTEMAARISSADISQFMTGRVQLLETLGTSPYFAPPRVAGIDARLERIPARSLGFTEGIVWFAPDGRARAGTGPAAGRRADPATAAFLAGVRRGEGAVSPALAGSVFGTPVILVGAVTGPRDAPTGIVVGAVSTEWIGGIARALDRTRGGATWIADQAGSVFVGRGVATPAPFPAPGLLARARATGGQGLISSGAVAGVRGISGDDDRLVGYAGEPARTGWTVFVERSEGAALAGPRRTLGVQIAALALLVGVGVAGAWLVGRRIDALARERNRLLVDESEARRQAEEARATAEEAEERAGLLAAVARQVEAEMGRESRLHRLAGAVVPALADVCIVEMRPEPDLELRDVADADRGREERTHAEAEGAGVRSLLRTAAGQPPQLVGIASGAAAAGAPAGIAALARLGLTSAALVPLSSRGAPLGAMLLGRRADRDGFTSADLAAMAALARHGALQLENAHLYERERGVATVLQRSLLPGVLAAAPGTRIAARYLPAAPGIDAGGDWYEAVALPGGRLGVAVGDAVGRGATAAAVMGQLRSALRALALEGHPPEVVLARLSAFAESVPGGPVATAAYAVLDPHTGALDYACAGHPPPLVVTRDGGARFLSDGRGPPLAVSAHPVHPRGRDELPCGGTLVLYSDGLVERRGETIDAGLARLAAVAPGGEEDPEVLCDRLISVLVGPGGADDVALLAVRLESVGAPDARAAAAPAGAAGA